MHQLKHTFGGGPMRYSGITPTSEVRESEIAKAIPSRFHSKMDRRTNGALVIMRAREEKRNIFCNLRLWFWVTLHEKRFVVLKRQNPGFGWRVYELETAEQLLSREAEEDFLAAVQEGYEVSVLSMGCKLERGHAFYAPLEWPYERYLEILSSGKQAWQRFLESKAARAEVY